MSRRPAPNHVTFSIASFAAWAPGVTTDFEWQEWASGNRPIAPVGEPALQQMPPLLRRHAGRLGRFACSVAYDSLDGASDVPVVMSSRYGEVSRSVELLSALAAHEELSPASFGLSVHNAIAGLFSMARKDSANSISLAAGDDSAEYGVLEACSLLRDGSKQVLLVVADVPLPDVYQQFQDRKPDAFGWACVLTQPEHPTHRLEWTCSSGANSNPQAAGIALQTAQAREQWSPSGTLRIQGALQVLPFLQGFAQECKRQSDTIAWHWRLND